MPVGPTAGDRHQAFCCDDAAPGRSAGGNVEATKPPPPSNGGRSRPWTGRLETDEQKG